MFLFLFSRVLKTRLRVIDIYLLWTPGRGWKGHLNQGLFILPIFCPSVRKFSRDWLISFFSETQHGVREPCVTESDFLKKIIFSKNEEMCQKWAKNRVFKIYWKIQLLIFLNLVYKESLYYLLYSCTNSISGKNLIPANQITGYLNQLYLQNKTMKKPDLMHADTDS